MVLGDRCEMVLSMRTEGMARCSQQKDLIKSPLLYIIICITFLYSCPKIASFDGSSTISKGNEHTMRENLLLRSTKLFMYLYQITTSFFVHIKKENGRENEINVGFQLPLVLF